MQVILLFVLGLVLVGIAYASFQEKLNIIKLMFTDFLLYISFYIIMSGIGFWLNIFTVERVLTAIIFCTVPIIAIQWKRGLSIDIEWNIKKYSIPVIIVICAIPFVLPKYEFFGMGQDEGVYQTQAIQFVYGYTDIQRDFEEYHMMDSEEAKEDIKMSLQEDLIGLYNYDPTLPFASENQEISEVSAVFHGVPTFSAILALFGKMFGISQMSFSQTLFYLCSVFILFFILEELKIKKTLKVVGTVLFAFSPLIFWVSKSALTEIGLTCLLLGFIYFILTMERKDIYLSTIPIVAFSFFHFTIYTMIPVFFLIYIGLYIYNRESEYLFSAIIINIGFFTGIMMSWMIAGTYTFVYNMAPLYRMVPGMSQENAMIYLCVGCGLIIVLCAILYVMRDKLDTIRTMCVRLKYVVIRFCFAGTALYQCKYLIEKRDIYQGGFNTLRHLTLAGFAYVVGVIFPVIAGILAVLLAERIFKYIRGTVVICLFVYCILFYSCVMRPETAYYYYYGRYLAPYISIVILFSVMALELISRQVIYIMGVFSLCILMPYEKVLLTEMDDTRITWDVIESFADKIDSGSIVIVTRDDMKFFYLPLRAITDAYVFPETEAVLTQIEEKYDNWYHIVRDSSDMEGAKLLLEKEYELSEDNNVYDGKWIPFPLNVTKDTLYAALWRYENER